MAFQVMGYVLGFKNQMHQAAKPSTLNVHIAYHRIHLGSSIYTEYIFHREAEFHGGSKVR